MRRQLTPRGGESGDISTSQNDNNVDEDLLHRPTINGLESQHVTSQQQHRHRHHRHHQQSAQHHNDGYDNEENDHCHHPPPPSSTSYEDGIHRIRANHVMRKMRFLTSMAAIGGFLFGYDTGVISGAMLPIRRAFILTPYQEEVVVSVTVLAALISSLIGGNLNEKLGRRMCCLIASTIFTLGSIVLLICWDYNTLVLGRIIVGLGIGIASLTTPVYISEAAIPRLRGRLVTVNALLVTLGQFTAGMVDGILDEHMPKTGWRYMLGLAAVPSTIMWWGFLHLPESPRWLANTGRLQEAEHVLRSLRETDQEALEELAEIRDALPQAVLETIQNNNNNNSNNDRSTGSTSHGHLVPFTWSAWLKQTMHNTLMFMAHVRDMVEDPATRRALILGCGLMCIQQLSGINTVMVRKSIS